MEEIKHRKVTVNGIRMHIAEKGEGPVVLFLHGFPELWYSWRHQIIALSSLGFHAVAPDFRGCGDTEAPSSDAYSFTCLHVVGDLIALIELLGAEKVFVAGHDFGAMIAWYLCLFRPERVEAFVCLSIPYLRRHPNMKPTDFMKAKFGDDYYVLRFQEPETEKELARLGTKEAITRMLSNRSPGPGIMPKEDPFGPLGFQAPLPFWLSDEDINYFAAKYQQTGFTGPLNYYRALDLNWELTAAWTGSKVLKVPVKFITGDLDTVYNTPGVKEFIQNGEFKKSVPGLEEIVIMEDVGHNITLEKPEEISCHIYDFINKF